MNAATIRTIRQTTALMTFVTAVVILLFAPGHVEFHVPFHLAELSEIFDSLLTAMIFYAAIGLLRGKRSGWAAAVIVMAVTTVWEIIISRHTLPMLAFIPFFVLVFILATAKIYSSRAEQSSRRLQIVVLITIVTTLIGCIGYLIVALETRRHFSLDDAIEQSLRHMYSLNTSWYSIFHPHLHTPVFAYTTLFMIGVLNYSLVAVALLQPVIESGHDTKKRDIRKILKRYGHGSEDYFKIFPYDKHYFTDPTVDGFIAYAQYESTCLILDQPIAKSRATRKKLLALFQLWCHERDLRVGAVPVSATDSGLYESDGFSLLKIGENAVVDLDKFSRETIRSKHFRNIINRFEKRGTTIDILAPPHDQKLLNELRKLSDEWLARGHDERGFALGYFDTSYLQQCRIITTRDSTNRIIGFINLLPAFDRQHASFDMMRTTNDAPKNTIDFLLAQTCLLLNEQAVMTLDFGLAPLAGLSDTDKATEKILSLISKGATRWYNFHGLRQFKSKFDPTWESAYLAYEGNPYRLMSYAVALLAILDRPVK